VGPGGGTGGFGGILGGGGPNGGVGVAPGASGGSAGAHVPGGGGAAPIGGSGPTAGSQGSTGGAAPAGAGGVPPGAGGSSGLCSQTVVDCNGNQADGCEVNTQTDAKNCGGCGKECPGAANATPYCFVGECHFGCSPGWGDCNAKPEDGCEADLMSDEANCGACRIACDKTECLSGGCKCAGDSVKPKKVPLDMYIVFDQSGSMNENAGSGSKWTTIVNALTTFVNNPDSAGLGVGIGYFPLVLQGAPLTCAVDTDCMVNGQDFGLCTGGIINGNMHFLGVCAKADACAGTSYLPDVPIATLPGVQTAIISSLGAHAPGGGTPTYPALQGAYAYAKTWAMAHPDHKTIVVLATDGDPSGCDLTLNNVNTIASNLVTPARTANPSILTFVIGVGASLTSLNAIAAAGGTGMALIVDTGSADPGGDFLAAMKKINASPALGCQYAIPAPPGGKPDYSKVNVQLTPDGGMPSVLRKVGDKSGCTSTFGGWYYDNNTTPTQIILCDETCTSINNGVTVQLDVLLGCASIG
jgi:hypothetical protein